MSEVLPEKSKVAIFLTKSVGIIDKVQKISWNKPLTKIVKLVIFMGLNKLRTQRKLRNVLRKINTNVTGQSNCSRHPRIDLHQLRNISNRIHHKLNLCRSNPADFLQQLCTVLLYQRIINRSEKGRWSSIYRKFPQFILHDRAYNIAISIQHCI